MSRLGDLGVVPMDDDDDDDRSPILENPLRFISVLLGDLATKLLTHLVLLLRYYYYLQLMGRFMVDVCADWMEDRCRMELLGVGGV
jgi:hypothetical protein